VNSYPPFYIDMLYNLKSRLLRLRVKSTNKIELVIADEKKI